MTSVRFNFAGYLPFPPGLCVPMGARIRRSRRDAAEIR